MKKNLKKRKKNFRNLPSPKNSKFYLKLLEEIGDLVQSIDLTGKYLYTNKKWQLALGYTKKEIAGMSFRQIVRRDQLSHCQKIFKEIIKGKAQKNIEVIFRTKEGKDLLLEGNMSPIYSQGKVVETIGVFREIAERKEQEKKIKEQRKFLENILDSLPYPLYVINAKDYSLTAANEAASIRSKLNKQPRLQTKSCVLPSLEKKKKDSISKIFSKNPPKITCFAKFRGRKYPCNSSNIPCPLEEIKQKKEPVKLEQIIFDKQGKRRIFEVNGYPIFDKQGKVTQIIEYAIDTTKHEKAKNILDNKISELEKINTLMIGREIKMVELKKELSILHLELETLKKKLKSKK